MKVLCIVGVLIGGYYYSLTHLGDQVLSMTQQLEQQYENAGATANQIAQPAGARQ